MTDPVKKTDPVDPQSSDPHAPPPPAPPPPPPPPNVGDD